MQKGVNNTLKKAMLFAVLLLSCLAVAQQEAPIATRRRFVGVASGATQKIPNPSGALLPSFAYTLVGAPSGVSIVAKGCMNGDSDAQNCVTLETDTSTTTSQIRTFSTNTTAYDYFLITPTFTGGTSPTLTINSTLPPFAKAGSSGTATPTGAAGGDLSGTYPNPSIAAGAVTDSKSSLAVKPAVTVVASANTALSGLLTIDSVVTADGSIVLATAQSAGAENGPWVVHSGAWTRPTWYPAAGTTQAIQFSTAFVRLGTVFSGSTWRLTTAAPITIDTTATTWSQTPLALNSTSVTGLLPAANLAAIAESGVTSLVSDLALKAPLASPTFTGTVTLPASQALVTPVLGTPASGVLTNTSGYKWDQLASPGGNQTLTMTGDSSTWNWGSIQFKFDTNGNPTYGLVDPTLAVTSSPTLSVCGSYQNAATPTFASDCWTIQNVLGAGTNGTGILTISQSGTTGARQMRLTSFQSNSPAYAIGTSNTGIGQDGSNNLVAYSGGNMSLAVTGGIGVAVGSAQRYAMTSGAANGTVDTGMSRGGAAKLVKVGNGTANDATGFIKTAQTAQIITADVTCGTGGTISSCVAMQTITGLSVTLPLVAANWSFTCDLIVGQATAAAANQIGIQTATNGATNLAASAIAYTAAATSTAGAITGVASSTTAQSVITFTPGATGTKMPIHLTGTIEGASASGTVLNITVLTGAAADLLTIYRGSSCYVY